jgi:hypothetical protein
MRYGLVGSLQVLCGLCVSLSLGLTLVGTSDASANHGLDWTGLGEVAPSGCFYPGPSQDPARYNRAILIASPVVSSLLRGRGRTLATSRCCGAVVQCMVFGLSCWKGGPVPSQPDGLFFEARR